MKFKPTLLAVLLAASANSEASVVYSQYFDNPGADAPLGTVGWKAVYGAAANVYDTSAALVAPNHLTVPILSANDLLYHNVITGSYGNSTGMATFHYVDGISVGFSGGQEFSHVSFSTQNDNGNENVRVALLIDGNWYVSNNSYNNQGATYGPNVAAVKANHSTAGATWSRLTVDLGFELSVGEAAELPTGTITGVGFYDAVRSSAVGTNWQAIRIDDLEIHASSDEPPSDNLKVISVTMSESPSQFSFTWESSPGATYTVYRTSDLSEPKENWEVLSNSHPSGGESTTYTDSPSEGLSRQFYFAEEN